MNLNKRLGIWGKDRIIRDDGKFHAGDYYCVQCYDNQKEVAADGFWPNIDPDIENFPYCNSCIKKMNIKVLLGLTKD